MGEPLAIGIVGGMSPESTVAYYQHIVHRHQTERRDHGYPRIIIASVSFQRYIDWQHDEAWDRIAESLQREFRAVAAAGADFAILATNTMHKVLPLIQSPITVLSILDVIGSYAKKAGIRSLGLTGTRFTMSHGFYAQGLENYGLRVITPTEPEQEIIHRIIYDELIFGTVNPSSMERFNHIAKQLLSQGADAILLGCTELEILARGESTQIRMLDSTKLHADAAWEMAIKGTS
jgi:aspartate racemase